MAPNEDISSRAYGKDGDLPLVCGFLSEAVAASPPHRYFHPGDFVWALFQNEVFDPRENVRLWEGDENELLGFALLEEPDGVVLQVRPDLRGKGTLEESMLSWAKSRQKSGAEAKTRSLETDAETNAFFKRRGFEREPHPSLKLLRHPLTNLPRPADEPSARPVGGEEEWERRVNLHREVWSPSRVTLAAYEKLRETPGYDPNLDLVALEPGGAFAAYCICWYDPHSRTGLFEPVGTHPAHRRMGLGRAVVAEGLRRLRSLGATSALVTCAHGNEAALRLYEDAGFEVVDREYVNVSS